MLVLIGSFLLLMLVGAPVAVALATSSLLYLVIYGVAPDIIAAQRMIAGVESFPLLAVPFFVLAGNLMNIAGVTGRIYSFALALVGWMKGGLAQVNVIGSVVFSGMSGTALADAAGIGTIEIKAMKDHGYPTEAAVGVTAASSTVGPIFPPSIPFVIYGMMANVSVGALFMAGILPGLLIMVMLCAANWYICRKRGYRSTEPKPAAREMLRTTLHALPALFLIVIIIGGIRTGIFTPTEASVVAVFYALVCGMFVYRSLRFRDLPDIIYRAALISVAVLLILAAARAFAWVLIIQSVPQTLAATIAGWELSPIVFLLAINVLLLAFGLFMDPLPGVMVLVPILAPIAHSLGIDPIHFAIVVIVNLTLGLITPPVGSLLFVVSSAVKLRVTELVGEMPAFFIAHVIVLLILTFVPAVSTWLPHVSGF